MDFTLLHMVQAILWMSTAAFAENEEKRLMNTLLKDYLTLARPVSDPNDLVNVELGMVLTSVSGVDETDQSLKCHGIVKMTWIDPFLTWNQTEHSGIQHIYLPPAKIWTPDIIVLNSLVSMLEPIQTGNALVKVWYNGSMMWMPSGQFNTECDMNITLFPFDIQSCSIAMGTNAYETDAVNITLRQEPRSAYRDTQFAIRGTNQWEILGEELRFLVTNQGARQIVVNNIRMSRRSRSFVMNVIFPSMVLAVVNVIVCIIPHELSDKVGVSTTLFLAYIIFLVQVTDSTPVNSDTIPFVSVVLLVLMSLSAIDVIFCIMLLKILGNGSSGPPPSWLIRALCLGKKTELMHNRVSEVSPSCDLNKDGGLEIAEVSFQGDKQKPWQPSWLEVSHRLEVVVMICQSLVALTMFCSVPALYFQSHL